MSNYLQAVIPLTQCCVSRAADPGLTEGEVAYKRERACQIAQRLLDWDVIADLELDTPYTGHSLPLPSIVGPCGYICLLSYFRK